MSSLPNFAEPNTFIRFQAPTQQFPSGKREAASLRFIRLRNREAPLKLVHRFTDLTPGERSDQKTFSDLEMAPDHVLHVFVGISPGARARFWHPNDVRILQWDESDLDAAERDTSNIEHKESPLENPQFDFWVAPTMNFTPAFDVENILSHTLPGRTIDVQLKFLGAKYTFDMIEKEESPELFRQLRNFELPSTFATFGGEI